MEHLAKIEELLKRYSQSYHFYLRDLVHDKIYELGTKKAYPICSCFKLAVLMAFFDSLESEEQLHQEVVIRPEEFSPGGGVLNYLSTPVKFTYFQLCQLMMAFSDGTATDLLMGKVGIEKINENLKMYAPNSVIKKNLKEMVQEFQAQYDISHLKNSASPVIAEFSDVTNASDLEALIWGSTSFKPRSISRESYMACLDVKKILPRCALFLNSGVKVYGKTGSLGHTYFANDCGVMSVGDLQVASFGVCAYGFKQDKDVAEHVFGLIGLEILLAVGVDLAPSARLTNHTRQAFGY